jgi:hypothetical protein
MRPADTFINSDFRFQSYLYGLVKFEKDHAPQCVWVGESPQSTNNPMRSPLAISILCTRRSASARLALVVIAHKTTATKKVPINEKNSAGDTPALRVRASHAARCVADI